MCAIKPDHPDMQPRPARERHEIDVTPRSQLERFRRIASGQRRASMLMNAAGWVAIAWLFWRLWSWSWKV